MLKKLSSLPYKSTAASIIGTVVTFALAKGYIDADWSMLISGLATAFFGTVNFSNKRV